ncbi:MAG: AtpZ/AtpI family protein [Peptococcaceae bacterium]|nr:AtpZ/AtpI family protein [Peptococcaceae bacterium]
MEKKTLSWIHYAAIGTGISAALAGLVVGGYFLGSWMDHSFDSYPLWTLVAIFVGVALGIAYMVFWIWKFMKSNDSSESGDKM